MTPLFFVEKFGLDIGCIFGNRQIFYDSLSVGLFIGCEN